MYYAALLLRHVRHKHVLCHTSVKVIWYSIFCTKIDERTTSVTTVDDGHLAAHHTWMRGGTYKNAHADTKAAESTARSH